MKRFESLQRLGPFIGAWAWVDQSALHAQTMDASGVSFAEDLLVKASELGTEAYALVVVCGRPWDC